MTLFMCSSINCDIVTPIGNDMDDDDDELVSEFVEDDVDVAGVVLLLLPPTPPDVVDGGMICMFCDINMGASPLPAPEFAATCAGERAGEPPPGRKYGLLLVPKCELCAPAMLLRCLLLSLL